MATLNLTTYRDVVKQLLDYVGGSGKGIDVRYAKQAVLNAYREFATAARWQYLYKHCRITTVASQTAGTIAYDNTTRQVTLTDSTWPSWAAYGIITIANINYDVVTRNSDTVITLSVNSNPGADVDAGTAYTIYRDTYALPLDFVSADRFQNMTNFFYPDYVHPRLWLEYQRLSKGPATPRAYTYRGSPHYQGAMSISFYPPPDAIYQFDAIYQRRPRQLSVYEENTGTVTVSSASSTVSGSGTAFNAKHVGSVLRFGSATNAPEGLSWSTPYERERIITAVASTTSLTVDTALDETLSGVKFVISDPIDIEPGAMYTAFQRCCEKEEAICRIMKNRTDAYAAYAAALILAREADSRDFSNHVAGQPETYPVRMAYMPSGADVS